MNRDYAATLAIAEQAAEWLERLPTATAAEREAFVAWLRASPVHLRELLLAVRCVEQLRYLDSARLMHVRDFIAKASVNVTPLANELATQRRLEPGDRSLNCRRLIRRRTVWKAAAVVSFIALVSLMTVAIQAVADRTIRTAAGEWHTTQLADGTILRAGPRTKATLEFTDRERVVRLSHGELMLHVAKDRSRPFSVETDIATARALSTAFAVRRVKRNQVVVTVKEGVVSVNRESPSTAPADDSNTAESAVMVNAGEQVRVAPGTLPLRVSQVNLNRELAWTIGKLVFGDGTTIADAVRELNVRNEVQIKLLSPQLAGRPIVGVMDASDPESLATLIEHTGDVTLIKDGRGLLLLVPHPMTTSADSNEKTEH